MKYAITAQAFDRSTGAPLAPAREEIIDTNTNAIFCRAENIMAVKKAYESFWNNMNVQSIEVVFVQSLRKVRGRSSPISAEVDNILAGAGYGRKGSDSLSDPRD